MKHVISKVLTGIRRIPSMAMRVNATGKPNITPYLQRVAGYGIMIPGSFSSPERGRNGHGIHDLEGLHHFRTDLDSGATVRRGANRPHQLQPDSRALPSRIKQQIYCPACDRTVERSELVKGYEIEKDAYVIVEDEEIKKIAPQSQETMEISSSSSCRKWTRSTSTRRTTSLPKSRASAPITVARDDAKDGFRGDGEDRHASARTYSRHSSPRRRHDAAHHFLRKRSRAVPEYGQTRNTEIKPQEITARRDARAESRRAIRSGEVRGHVPARLSEMLEAKRQGRVVGATQTKKMAPVIDLMAALQRSLNQKAGVAMEEPKKAKRNPRERRERESEKAQSGVVVQARRGVSALRTDAKKEPPTYRQLPF